MPYGIPNCAVPKIRRSAGNGGNFYPVCKASKLTSGDADEFKIFVAIPVGSPDPFVRRDRETTFAQCRSIIVLRNESERIAVSAKRRRRADNTIECAFINFRRREK